MAEPATIRRSEERSARSCRWRDVEMLVGSASRDPAARGSLQKALLNQEGLVEVLEGTAILANGGSDSLKTGRASSVLFDQGHHELAIAIRDFEQCVVRRGVDGAIR